MRQPTLLVHNNVCRSDTPEEFHDSCNSNEHSSPEHPMSLQHVDMSTSPFHDAADATMGDVACSTGAPASASTYASSDQTPYSASMSPQFYAADPNLLTPVSSAASPPLHHRAKSGGPYDSPEELQQPTPPGSSKLFFTYDMGPSSQSSSPMAMHTQIPPQGESHFDMANFIHTSPTEPEVVPYFGAFGVSEGPESSDRPAPLSRFQTFPGALADPLQVTGGEPPHYSTMVPDLASPQLSTLFRPVRGSIIEDLKSNPSLTQSPYPSFDGLPTELSHPPAKRDRAGSRPNTTNNRVRKPKRRNDHSRAASASGTPIAGAASLADSTHTSPQQPPRARSEPTLTFSDKASDEDHALLELRKANSDGKGKGMWDAITRYFAEKFNVKVQRAALQMKLSRAVCKHGIWPDHEIDRLIEAYNYDEEHKYARIIARMKEQGGGQVWDWKPPHIEAELVKLGMEEPIMDQKSKTRRKARMAQRKRSAAAAHPYIHTNPTGNGTIVDWMAMPAQQHNGMLAPHAFGGARSMSVSGFEMANGAAPAPGSDEFAGATRIDQHFYPSDQENEVIDEIHRKYGSAESPEPEPSNNRLGISYAANDASSAAIRDDDVSQQSHRVALQACHTIMAENTFSLAHLQKVQ